MYDAEAMERDKIAIQHCKQLFLSCRVLSCLGFMSVLAYWGISDVGISDTESEGSPS